MHELIRDITYCILFAWALGLLAHFSRQDILLRPLGNTIYVMPPYCIDDADLERIYLEHMHD